jgi:hypothetical protein
MRKPVAGTPVWVMPASVVAGIAVLVAAFLVYRYYTTPVPPPAPSQDTTAKVLAIITNLPASEFDTVGEGTAENLIKPVSGTVLTGASGKPEILYIGAEFCPFCAAQRWALIVALSRFGTFSGLQTTTSSSSDVFPDTPTFSFRSATYSSQYIDFRAIEVTDRDQNPLQSPSPSETQVWVKYDSARTIPFVDFANGYAFTGALNKPDTLSGNSWLAIAADLKDPTSPQAKAVIGSANLVTAAVCKITNGQPSAVCSSATIQNLENNLK